MVRVGLHTRGDYPVSPFLSSPLSCVLPPFQLTSCRLAFTLAKATWRANQLSGSWQGIWIHSGVPLTSLFSYHWASRTQREQEALDPNDLSLFPVHTCFHGTAVLALAQRMTSWEGDRQGLHRQMVVRSNNEYLQVSAQTNAYFPTGQWSLSVKDAFIGSRGIHRQRASIPQLRPGPLWCSSKCCYTL